MAKLTEESLRKARESIRAGVQEGLESLRAPSFPAKTEMQRLTEALYDEVFRCLTEAGAVDDTLEGRRWVERWWQPYTEAIKMEQRKCCAQFED